MMTLSLRPMVIFALRPDARPEDLGFIPTFLIDSDARPVREQFNERYCSGWRPQPGFTYEPKKMLLQYPGDPDLQPRIGISFHDEIVLLYDHDVVAIVQKDGSFEACRMD
jgi:hypothetical protein